MAIRRDTRPRGAGYLPEVNKIDILNKEPNMSFSDHQLINRLVMKNLDDIFIDVQKKISEESELEIDINHIKEYVGFPLDAEICEKLKKLISTDDPDDYTIFHHIEDVKIIWKIIIEKSVKCLRYFDNREPFMKNPSKLPVAYGIQGLVDYYDQYTTFEDLLYGSNKYYRDHVVHVLRVWMIGNDLLLRDNGKYIKRIEISLEKTSSCHINALEILSIWSLIAVTHDLGYPLEKSQLIIEKTQKMMKTFVSNPNITMDLSFSGVQNNMNDFVLRFMSSKMESKKDATEIDKKIYAARLQPKYYFKFQKALENSQHDVVSAIIIYKLLIYFLESDFSINEDYYFEKEEMRQFIIRREILRAISSHTCSDIYHLYIDSLSFLLILSDDCQEWGRKRISELYTSSDQKYELDDILFNFETGTSIMNACVVKESFKLVNENVDALNNILKSLFKQCNNYMTVFRDGQETAKRDFKFSKISSIKHSCPSGDVNFRIEFIISNSQLATFQIVVDKIHIDDLKKYDFTFIYKALKSELNGLSSEKLIEAITAESVTYRIPCNR